MKTALPLLLAPALLAAAPGKPAPKKDYGTLALGSEAYRFRPETLSASQASKGQPMSLYVKGQLVPVKGGKPLVLTFQLFRPGPMAGMTLGPRTGKGATFVATMQSKVDAAYPDPPKLGDEATFSFTGPLMKTEGSATTQSSWQGQIKAVFTSVP